MDEDNNISYSNNIANNRKINLIENNESKVNTFNSHSINEIDLNEKNLENNFEKNLNIKDTINQQNSEREKEFNYNSNNDEILLSNCLSQILKNPENASDLFVSNIIPYQNFSNDPWSVINNTNILIKNKEKLLPIKVALPILLSKLLYNTDLNENSQKNLFINKSFFGKISNPQNELEKIKITDFDIENSRIKISNKKFEKEKIKSEYEKEFLSPKKINTEKDKELKDSKDPNSAPNFPINRKESFNKLKSQIPSTNQIKLLNLKPGRNVIKFICKSRLSGENILESEIYLWEKNEKIIISDVDGTITKSDVLGQLMPMFGNDWAQPGVSKLYNSIEKNGYKIIYLTARAICQSSQTKNYLNKLNQDNLQLPKGPLVMSPDGLFTSFKREVIDKTPQVK